MSMTTRTGQTSGRIGAPLRRLLGVVAMVSVGAVLATANDGSPALAQIVMATPTTTALTFQDNDPFMVYQGDWSRVEDAKAVGGTRHQSRQAGALMKLVQTLEDDDDVQAVYSNFEVSDEVMARLTAA